MQQASSALANYLKLRLIDSQPASNPTDLDREEMSDILDRFVVTTDVCQDVLEKWYDAGYACGVHALSHAANAGFMQNVRFLLSRGHFIHGRGLECLYEKKRDTEEMIEFVTSPNNRALGMGAPFIYQQTVAEKT